MTLHEMVRVLGDAGVDTPEQDALLLLAHFCGVSRSAARFEREREYSDPILARALARRARREPLQYILGHWFFMRERYEVSPDCLIPRPETELLTERAIALLPENGRLLDLCCGSGCIAISALAARPDCSGAALDLFSETLSLATRNAARAGVLGRLTFARGDVTDAATAERITAAEFAMPIEGFDASENDAGLRAPTAAETAAPTPGRFDIITANPPYIPTGELAALEPELSFEPTAALDGGEDGLRFYRALLSFWLPALAPGGVMLLEIGASQGEDIAALAKTHHCAYTLLPDLSGYDRVAELRPPR